MTSKPSTVVPPDQVPLFTLEKDFKELEFMEEKLEREYKFYMLKKKPD